MNEARLIIDEPQSGSRNMAVDQALLQSANDFGHITVRFYQWKPATLSLGYFQKSDDRRQHGASQKCPVLRRASGGGAIVHDQEWTYSVALPAKDRLSKRHDSLVEEMHGVLIELLAQFGIVADLHSVKTPVPSFVDENNFLCFQRRAINDLIVGEHKICGSAQRRVEGAILQHGSLIFRQSEFAPELPGFLDLADVNFGVGLNSQFFSNWQLLISRRWGVQLSDGKLSEKESVLASEIEAGKFSSDPWTFKR